MIQRPLALDGFTMLESAADHRSLTAKVGVEGSNAFVSGHFPGEPILPGVAHLGLARQAAEGLHGRSVRLTGVRDLRLRQIVRPGDVIEVRVTPTSTDGESRFEIRKGDLLASSGILIFASLVDGE